jgi:hypothetical protein
MNPSTVQAVLHERNVYKEVASRALMARKTQFCSHSTALALFVPSPFAPTPPRCRSIRYGLLPRTPLLQAIA